MENTSRIQQFIAELNSKMPLYYNAINDAFNTEFGYPALDPVRDEICKCIICGLPQATITLTNHLLEKSLKFCLGVKYSSNNKKEGTKLENIFQEGIEKFDRNNLEQTINHATSKGLITKEQKKQLIQFKKTFRNPYSHANTDIFKDISVMGKCVTTKDLEDGLENFLEKCFDSSSDIEMTFKNLPFAQGIFQKKIAQEDCIPYFMKVDEIIRSMLSNLKNKEIKDI
jgi:hypothetical protein